MDDRPPIALCIPDPFAAKGRLGRLRPGPIQTPSVSQLRSNSDGRCSTPATAPCKSGGAWLFGVEDNSPGVCSDFGEVIWGNDRSYSTSPEGSRPQTALESAGFTRASLAKGGGYSRPHSRGVQFSNDSGYSPPQSRPGSKGDGAFNSRPQTSPSRTQSTCFFSDSRVEVLSPKRSPNVELAVDDTEIFGRNAGIRLSLRPLSRSSSLPVIPPLEKGKSIKRERIPVPMTYLVSDAHEQERACRQGRMKRRSSQGQLRAATLAVMATMRSGRRCSFS